VLVKEGDKVKAGQLIAKKGNGIDYVAPADGTVTFKKANTITIIFEQKKVREYIIPPGYMLYVKDGDEVQAGDALTDGHLDLQVLFKYKGQDAVQKYLSTEIQFIYSSQGQKLNNKHIEIIVRQMFSRVKVVDPGDTDLLPGETIERATFDDANDTIEKGQKKATSEPLFLGITKISLSTDSWLSSASFQETARVLINASVTGKIDRLDGLKENVIIGRLIPAGTGYKDMQEELIGDISTLNEEVRGIHNDVESEIDDAFSENKQIGEEKTEKTDE
jgi:DNA-directed RNA polymerase subunit beta'